MDRPTPPPKDRPSADGYALSFPLSQRLGDLFAYGLVSGRLTDIEVEWVELALMLLDCVCGGLLLLREPRRAVQRLAKSGRRPGVGHTREVA